MSGTARLAQGPRAAQRSSVTSPTRPVCPSYLPPLQPTPALAGAHTLGCTQKGQRSVFGDSPPGTSRDVVTRAHTRTHTDACSSSSNPPPVTRPHVHPCTRISTLGVDGHPQAGGLGHTYVHTRKCSLTPIWHSHDCLTPRLMSLGVNKALSLAHL